MFRIFQSSSFISAALVINWFLVGAFFLSSDVEAQEDGTMHFCRGDWSIGEHGCFGTANPTYGSGLSASMSFSDVMTTSGYTVSVQVQVTNASEKKILDFNEEFDVRFTFELVELVGSCTFDEFDNWSHTLESNFQTISESITGNPVSYTHLTLPTKA